METARGYRKAQHIREFQLGGNSVDNFTKEITPDMISTVNRLEKSNFENATPDDIKIYAQWASLRALQEKTFEDKRKQTDELIKAQIEDSKRQADASVEALNALTELAKARLKAVEYGKTEQK